MNPHMPGQHSLTGEWY